MKKVLVVDWLDKYGGAEKVIQALEKCIGFDEVYALANVMNNRELLKMFPYSQPVKTTFLQKSGKRFRWLFPLFFWAIDKIRIPENTRLIVSSSHSVAKGVRKSSPKQVHISYFQAPNSNYIWQDAPLYFKFLYPAVKWVLPLFRKWDVADSTHPDFIICNSHYVKDWVKKNYNREADVIYPPVNLDSFQLLTAKEEFYVISGRMAAIKRFDVVIEAFNSNDRRLVVIGDGEELSHLKALAKSPKIVFTGFQEVAAVSGYLQRAKAYIQMGVEGFGIGVIEAQSCGTPVICYGKGGVVETVIPGETGLFFKKQTAASLNECIEIFEHTKFDFHKIHEHARKFSEEHFCETLKEYIRERLH